MKKSLKIFDYEILSIHSAFMTPVASVTIHIMTVSFIHYAHYLSYNNICEVLLQESTFSNTTRLVPHVDNHRYLCLQTIGQYITSLRYCTLALILS